MWGYRRFKHIPTLGNPYNVDEETLAKFILDNKRADQNVHDTTTRADNEQ